MVDFEDWIDYEYSSFLYHKHTGRYQNSYISIYYSPRLDKYNLIFNQLSYLYNIYVRIYGADSNFNSRELAKDRVKEFLLNVENLAAFI